MYNDFFCKNIKCSGFIFDIDHLEYSRDLYSLDLNTTETKKTIGLHKRFTHKKKIFVIKCYDGDCIVNCEESLHDHENDNKFPFMFPVYKEFITYCKTIEDANEDSGDPYIWDQTRYNFSIKYLTLLQSYYEGYTYIIGEIAEQYKSDESFQEYLNYLQVHVMISNIKSLLKIYTE